MLGSFKGAHLGLNTIFKLKNKNNAWLLGLIGSDIRPFNVPR